MAALWAGTSVLITDERGRVLVQEVDYLPFRLLPGGTVDQNPTRPPPGEARGLPEWYSPTVGRKRDRGPACWAPAFRSGDRI